MTLWHHSRDSAERLEQLLPWRASSVRARPLLFAMDACVAAIQVALEAGDEGVGEGGDARGDALPTATPRLPVPSFNSHPHVTLWVAQKGLARLSNPLLARVASPDGKPLPLTAVRSAVVDGSLGLGAAEAEAEELEAGSTCVSLSCLGLPPVCGRVEFYD